MLSNFNYFVRIVIVIVIDYFDTIDYFGVIDSGSVDQRLCRDKCQCPCECSVLTLRMMNEVVKDIVFAIIVVSVADYHHYFLF